MSDAEIKACNALIKNGERIYKKDLPKHLHDFHDVISQYPAEFVVKFELLEDKIADLKKQLETRNEMYENLLAGVDSKHIKNIKQIVKNRNPYSNLVDIAVKDIPSLIAFIELKAVIAFIKNARYTIDGSYEIEHNYFINWTMEKEKRIKNEK